MPKASSHFFAYVSRLRWIKRWGLMRNAIEENVATHSWEVATLAHALAMIRNRHFGGQVNADKIAAAALYHDATEVITGDMPTPVKYHSKVMREAFGDIEHKAESELLALLPEDLREDFAPYLQESQLPEGDRELIKAADRLSAWLKCQAEVRAGNREFEPAERQIRQRLEEEGLPEVNYFMEVFAPSYEEPLDNLLG
ncbi:MULTISPECIES: 5'-deoxynucleotidase [Marinobacter]|uniref:5'-deoxynucleotidase n=1 Tax=Marinobacter xiaoshiensis TaxID=3073652 RepID=A0ABU2HDN0_9GAMM|nr:MULTISPECIES: 5'-deoxynucleotidase [unclassified Marinobacter]MBK1872386.1 5'-deoxynucleotidase [Marinobacter sp. 1-3A]MBK1887280.1 5'-deoxynucleotidase [Marinobacter sp. DY40_1A1]MDS1308848.1 5'-deoxynucleotidase [Marinobacter sp. F60267]